MPQQSQNWDESKHPRDELGEFTAAAPKPRQESGMKVTPGPVAPPPRQTLMFDTNQTKRLFEGALFEAAKKTKKTATPTLGPSLLERIEDEIAARAAENKPLGGQRELFARRFERAMDRYAQKWAKGQSKLFNPSKQGEFHWVTIGGHPDDKGHHHAGGTPVKIDGAGNIAAGPKALADKGIKNLDDFGSGQKPPEVDTNRTFSDFSGQNGTSPENPGSLAREIDPEEDYRQNGTRAKAFKQWFGDWEHDPANASKVVNPETGEPQETSQISGNGSKVIRDGKPVTVYHGTQRGGFDRFDASKNNKADELLYGPGFYFTEDPTVADEYAGATKFGIQHYKTEQEALDAIQQNADEWRGRYGDQKRNGIENLKFFVKRETAAPEGSDLAYLVEGHGFYPGQARLKNALTGADMVTLEKHFKGIASEYRKKGDKDNADFYRSLAESARGYGSFYKQSGFVSTQQQAHKERLERFLKDPSDVLPFATEDDKRHAAEALEKTGNAIAQDQRERKEVYLNIRKPFDADTGEIPMRSLDDDVLDKVVRHRGYRKETLRDQQVNFGEQAARQRNDAERAFSALRKEMGPAADKLKDHKAVERARQIGDPEITQLWDSMSDRANTIWGYFISAANAADKSQADSNNAAAEIRKLDTSGATYHELQQATQSKQRVREILQQFGHDGITHTGGRIMGNRDHRVWIAFEPNQIKATNNRGTFDPKDERMTYSRSGAVDRLARRFERAVARYSNVEWVRAPKGGAVSPVNQQHYEGGEFMPIHGKSEKKAGEKAKKKPTPALKALNRFDKYEDVPEGYRAITSLVGGHPQKSHKLGDDALSYLGLTREHLRQLKDIWEAGDASIPAEVIPPTARSTKGTLPPDGWNIEKKLEEFKKKQGEEVRAKWSEQVRKHVEEEKAAREQDSKKETEPKKQKELFARRFSEAIDRYYRSSAMRRSIESAAASTDLEPSPEQKEAGNYRKGRFNWHGLTIAIENPRGSYRSGKSRTGKTWSTEMTSHYGYILRNVSKADGDHVDVFIGPYPESDLVCVIDQRTPGRHFDEHKVMIGFTSIRDAKRAYLANYSSDWTGLESITALTVPQFKNWLRYGDTGTRISGQVSRYAKRQRIMGAPDLPAPATPGTSRRGDGGASEDRNGHWVTMHGTHVFIAGNEIVKGPENLTAPKTAAAATPPTQDQTRAAVRGMGKLGYVYKGSTPDSLTFMKGGQEYTFSRDDVDEMIGAKPAAPTAPKPAWKDFPVPDDIHFDEWNPDDDGEEKPDLSWKNIEIPDDLTFDEWIDEEDRTATPDTLPPKKSRRQAVQEAASEAARNAEVPLDDVLSLMPEAHKFMKQQQADREKGKAWLRRVSGLNAGRLARLENKYFDHSSVANWDTTAREFAINHPDLGFDPDGDETPAAVWDFLREGKAPYLAAHDPRVAELAAEWARPKTRAPERQAGDEEDYPNSLTAARNTEEVVPFSRRRLADKFSRLLQNSARLPLTRFSKLADNRRR